MPVCKLKSHYEVQRSSTAVGLVAAGVGAAVVPSLALLLRKGRSLSPAAQALVDLIVGDASRRRPGAKAIFMRF